MQYPVQPAPETDRKKFLSNLITSFLQRNTLNKAPYSGMDFDNLVDTILSLVNCPYCKSHIKSSEVGNNFIVKFKRMIEGTWLPERQHDNDVGYDIRSMFNVTLNYMETVEVHAGFALELPDDIYYTIEAKSRFNKNGIHLFTPIYDAGYRGPVSCFLLNTMSQPFEISKGERFAQIVFHKRHDAKFITVDELSPSTRGEGRYGSTGIFTSTVKRK